MHPCSRQASPAEGFWGFGVLGFWGFGVLGFLFLFLVSVSIVITIICRLFVFIPYGKVVG